VRLAFCSINQRLDQKRKICCVTRNNYTQRRVRRKLLVLQEGNTFKEVVYRGKIHKNVFGASFEMAFYLIVKFTAAVYYYILQSEQKKFQVVKE